MYRSTGLHKLVTAAVAFTLLGSALAGCGGDTNTPATGGGATAATATTATGGGATEATATTAGGATTPAAGGATGGTSGVSDKYKGTTLNIVMANHAWNTGITPLLPQFEQASGIKLNVSSYGETQLSDQLTVKFTSGGGDIDAFMFRPPQEGLLFANNGWLADITSMTQGAGDWTWDDFQKAARSSATINSKVYGVPIVTEREILYYRKDLLQAKNIAVPKTLDEMMAAAEKLNDPNNGMYGLRGPRPAEPGRNPVLRLPLRLRR